jgi:regulator of protease activity HflC (stomatin/prohibitin superfamily)
VTALMPLFILFGIFGLIILISLLRSIRIVPAMTALVVERLGQYARTLEAGFHVLLPFLDQVRYHHSLKEQAIEVPTQPCFTRDNVKVEIDGVLYFKVIDPAKASYGISDYRYAAIQLAQTTMRSVIGKLELDKTFEERENINVAIVRGVGEATAPWGVQITRYEIQNIRVPETILIAMENQMKAEREKRAAIAKSMGEMQSKINYSQGVMTEAVNKSEGEKQRVINEAEGRAGEIRTLATATAAGLEKIAAAIQAPGGEDALLLQTTETYLDKLSGLARPGTEVILPLNLTDFASLQALVKKMLGRT